MREKKRKKLTVEHGKGNIMMNVEEDSYIIQIQNKIQDYVMHNNKVPKRLIVGKSSGGLLLKELHAIYNLATFDFTQKIMISGLVLELSDNPNEMWVTE